ncbi:MAG: ribokinase [Gemmatimonadales bacterium]
MPPRIAVIGSSNTDLVVRAPALPAAGQTVLGTSFFSAAGGKGANQAVAAARLGAQVTLVARVGLDEFGQASLSNLRSEGIDTSFVVEDPDALSGVALIVVCDEGENAIAVAPGANALLGPEDVDRAAEAIEAADILLMQLETPMPTVACAVSRAQAAGVPVILNPAPAAPIDVRVLRDVSVLTPNTGEAIALAGVGGSGIEAARLAARQLRAAGVRRVIVTLGAEGALLEEEGTSAVRPAPPVAAVDTTAAGDAFNGALAVALAEGARLEAAADFANRAAALSTTREGAQPSLPTRPQVDAFARDLGHSA